MVTAGSPSAIGDGDRGPDDAILGQLGLGLPSGGSHGRPVVRNGLCAEVPGLGDHRADADHRAHQAVGLQRGERLGGGGDGHAPVLGDLPRRRHPVTGPELTGHDSAPDLVDDALVRRVHLHLPY